MARTYVMAVAILMWVGLPVDVATPAALACMAILLWTAGTAPDDPDGSRQTADALERTRTVLGSLENALPGRVSSDGTAQWESR